MTTRLAPFDAADYLDSEETIDEYLAAASDDPDPEMYQVALITVARSRAIKHMSEGGN